MSGEEPQGPRTERPTLPPTSTDLQAREFEALIASIGEHDARLTHLTMHARLTRTEETQP